MDEVGTAQQYYIAAGSSPSDDRARVLKYGKCFAVFNRYGDIEPLGLGELGIFFQSCRHLSEFVLNLWEARPLLLSSTVKSDNFVFLADLENVDVAENGNIVVPRGTLHVVRSREVVEHDARPHRVPHPFADYAVEDLHPGRLYTSRPARRLAPP